MIKMFPSFLQNVLSKTEPRLIEGDHLSMYFGLAGVLDCFTEHFACVTSGLKTDLRLSPIILDTTVSTLFFLQFIVEIFYTQKLQLSVKIFHTKIPNATPHLVFYRMHPWVCDTMKTWLLLLSHETILYFLVDSAGADGSTFRFFHTFHLSSESPRAHLHVVGMLFSWHKPTKLAHSFLFCSCAHLCLNGPFNCISFHKCSRQLSAFPLNSSSLISASMVLSTVYLFMKVYLALI